MPTERKSYFSKAAISGVIEEILNYIDNLNKDVKDYKTVPKETLGAYLVAEKKISEAIYDTLTEHQRDFGNCHAMVKKGRCGNPITKVNRKFCALHTNNPPDMTWEEYEKAKSLVG